MTAASDEQTTTTYNYPIQWTEDYTEAMRESQATSKPILILFTGSTWCPACIRLEREVVSRPEFASALGDKFIFVKADFPEYSEAGVRRSPFKPLLERYKVTSFPTIIVVNTSGEQLFTVGYQMGGVKAYTQQILRHLDQGRHM